VERRPLQVRPSPGAVIDMVPPRGAVRRVPSRKRDVIAGVDAHPVVGQRDNQQDGVDAEDRPRDCARRAIWCFERFRFKRHLTLRGASDPAGLIEVSHFELLAKR